MHRKPMQYDEYGVGFFVMAPAEIFLCAKRRNEVRKNGCAQERSLLKMTAVIGKCHHDMYICGQ